MNSRRDSRSDGNDDGFDASGLSLERTGESIVQSGQLTSRRAAQILAEKSSKYVIPTASQRQNLLVAFAKTGKAVYGRAFDLVKLERPLNLSDLHEVESHLSTVTLIEVKSTKKQLPPDFAGFFFALTGGEVLVAQSLKSQFRFALVNTVSEDYLEMSLGDIFSRARGIYPTWSVSF